MPSLPTPGGSTDTWGAELNTFLEVTLNPSTGGFAAAVAGAGLGVSGGVLSVGVDGSTLEISSDALRVKDGGVSAAKLAAGAAATNLTGGSPPNYTVSNATTDRTFNADATTIDELADVLGTLIADLIAQNLLS